MGFMGFENGGVSVAGGSVTKQRHQALALQVIFGKLLHYFFHFLAAFCRFEQLCFVT